MQRVVVSLLAIVSIVPSRRLFYHDNEHLKMLEETQTRVSTESIRVHKQTMRELTEIQRTLDVDLTSLDVRFEELKTSCDQDRKACKTFVYGGSQLQKEKNEIRKRAAKSLQDVRNAGKERQRNFDTIKEELHRLVTEHMRS